MDSIILATFQNLQDAENGLEKIKELDLLEDIDVNNILLVQKKLRELSILQWSKLFRAVLRVFM